MIVDSLAEGYERVYDGFYEEAPYQSPATSYAAGGLFSTVSDLYRWEQLLYTDRLLTEGFPYPDTHGLPNRPIMPWAASWEKPIPDAVIRLFSAPRFPSPRAHSGKVECA
ncbi:MAG: hypothetical protein U5K69_29640 [Balneolaceae bacterium]|nr:hypothetical protein [Balneolaceae bacterium]